jgi:hypothetical protein
MAILKSITYALVGVELTPYIDVNRLSTANSMPTISGTAVFNRFDSLGNPDQAIEVILNYRPYYLFEGNLGLVNTDIPGVYVWRLHVDSPLYPGTYDVEANIYSVNTDQILASDNSVNELTILNPQRRYGGQPAPAANKSLAQKAAVVAGLMNSLSNMFGNSGVGGPSPAVHPVQDDQASSPLVGRGNEERSEDTMVKSKDTVKDKAYVPAKNHSFGATDPGSADEPPETKDVEATSMDQANSDLGDAKKEQEDANASQEKPQEEPPQKDPRDVPDDGRERPATPEEMFAGNPTLLAAYYKREGVSQKVAEF